MTKIKNLIKLIRIKNWIKNGLILMPLLFSGLFLNYNQDQYINLIAGVTAFCLVSSIVYIFNDIIDINNDRKDDIKKHRPLASNTVKIYEAVTLALFLLILAITIFIIFKLNYNNIAILAIYLLLNIIYSLKFKNIPIIDISVLSCFFIIRLIYGSILCNAPVSGYLYLTTLMIAYYFGIGKRRKELENNIDIRPVLKEYSSHLLSSLHTVFLSASIISYSLWAINYNLDIINSICVLISAFIVTMILLYYHYVLYNYKTGNPIDVLLNNKALITLCIIYIIYIAIGMFI